MTDIAIEFCHVWKKFKKGELHDSLRDLIPALLKEVFSAKSRDPLQGREFWALQDVSFQLRRGQALGVIGPNGAGKSTTLKLLSGILRPNNGQIKVNGRLSALIEVGAGFHPDLTGRENIFLNGVILGMSRKEIAARFEEIVEFSGLADFINTPVKRYSSGMYARLGFSVAAHVNPDILLVDEVLSVGDMQFQQKCLDRMKQILAQGTTIVFVSHNLQSVQMLCPDSLLLESGKITMLGATANVITRYVCTPKETSSKSDTGSTIEGIALSDELGRQQLTFLPGQRARLKFILQCDRKLRECLLGFRLDRVTDGLPVCDYYLPLAVVDESLAPSTDGVPLVLDFSVNLLRGAYVLSLHLWDSSSGNLLCCALRVLNFTVEETQSWQGVSHLEPVVSRVDTSICRVSVS